MNDLPDPVEAIKFRMEQYGHNQTQTAKELGISRSKMNEIIKRKRHLSIGQIRKLWKYGVPLHVLIQEYRL
jgi:antitoxin component HigA of HigAB toxin-antitoxin module